jgi:hypothetical protein
MEIMAPCRGYDGNGSFVCQLPDIPYSAQGGIQLQRWLLVGELCRPAFSFVHAIVRPCCSIGFVMRCTRRVSLRAFDAGGGMRELLGGTELDGRECCGDPGDCGDATCGSARSRQPLPVSTLVYEAGYLSRIRSMVWAATCWSIRNTMGGREHAVLHNCHGPSSHRLGG